MRFTDGIDNAAWRRLGGLASALAIAGCSQSTLAPPPALPGAAPVSLAAPAAARNWDDFKIQAARRMIAANPTASYTSPAPEPLLAIPVLEIELNGDGSVRNIKVLRVPTQAKDTTQLAIDAVKRAAPFGDMSRLSKPWKYAEVFLFDDDRRFKPRTLD